MTENSSSGGAGGKPGHPIECLSTVVDVMRKALADAERTQQTGTSKK
jgi:hypothetical protein